MAQQGGVTEIVMVHLYYLVPVKKEVVAAAMMNKQRMQWLAYCSRKATLHRNTSCSCCCLNLVFFWEECCCLNSWAAAAGLGRKPQAPVCAPFFSFLIQIFSSLIWCLRGSLVSAHVVCRAGPTCEPGQQPSQQSSSPQTNDISAYMSQKLSVPFSIYL